jgi:hypothetical protein
MLSALSQPGPVRLKLVDLLLQPSNPPLNGTSLGFQLGFPWTPRANAAP